MRLGGSHLTARNRSSAATGPDLRRPDLDDDLDLGLDQVSPMSFESLDGTSDRVN